MIEEDKLDGSSQLVSILIPLMLLLTLFLIYFPYFY